MKYIYVTDLADVCVIEGGVDLVQNKEGGGVVTENKQVILKKSFLH